MKSLLCTFVASLTLQLHAQDLIEYVNPFVGTANGGNTFPGAVLPWGMVSVSPHNSPGSPSGYIYGKRTFYGFGHVHLSGTGCADLGSIILTVSRGVIRTRPDEYKVTGANEEARAGFYRIQLVEPEILAEVTATTRCGVTRFTSQRDGDINILIDAGRSLALSGGGGIRILGDSAVEGYNTSGGFCGEANRQRVYFSARLSERADSSGVWEGDKVSRVPDAAAVDSAVGCWLRFRSRAGKAIIVRVGISYVSIENARENLEIETTGRDFESLKAEASGKWERELSKIHVEGGTDEDRTKFYTSLYHTLIHPNVISDVNGEYPLMGRSGKGKYLERDRYSVFSLWDTYRTLHPLLTLVYPERQSAMVRTMIDMYRESGWLPKWELAGNETYMMAGDPAAIVIADTYVKGVTDFDIAVAYEGMTKPDAWSARHVLVPLRPGYEEFTEYHYIPCEQDTTREWWVWGPVSTTLEYCLADWGLAQVARRLGRDSDATKFLARSQFYGNLFDTSTHFMRPRLRNGHWLQPFDPGQTEGSGNWSGSGGPGYVEGNAWQYTWFVPHDVEGLVTLFGGARSFAQALDSCFVGGHFTIGNEPDMGYPYLYSYLDSTRSRTVETVREIMSSSFNATPGGLPGNDDAGAISAWYVFSSLGFYPVCPGSDNYRLGIPAFRRTTLYLNRRYYSGTEFRIETRGGSARSSRVRSIDLNGEKIDAGVISQREVTAGGRLVFDQE